MKTGLGVGGGIHNPRYLRPSQGSHTHHAGFERNVQRTIRQVLSPQIFRCCRNGKDFGVRRGVLQLLHMVTPTPYNSAPIDHNSANRHLSRLFGKIRFIQSGTHGALVFCLDAFPLFHGAKVLHLYLILQIRITRRSSQRRFSFPPEGGGKYLLVKQPNPLCLEKESIQGRKTLFFSQKCNDKPANFQIFLGQFPPKEQAEIRCPSNEVATLRHSLPQPIFPARRQGQMDN